MTHKQTLENMEGVVLVNCYYLAVLSPRKMTLISKEAARHGAIVHVMQKNKTV